MYAAAPRAPRRSTRSAPDVTTPNDDNSSSGSIDTFDSDQDENQDDDSSAHAIELADNIDIPDDDSHIAPSSPVKQQRGRGLVLNDNDDSDSAHTTSFTTPPREDEVSYHSEFADESVLVVENVKKETTVKPLSMFNYSYDEDNTETDCDMEQPLPWSVPKPNSTDVEQGVFDGNNGNNDENDKGSCTSRHEDEDDDLESLDRTSNHQKDNQRRIGLCWIAFGCCILLLLLLLLAAGVYLGLDIFRNDNNTGDSIDPPSPVPNVTSPDPLDNSPTPLPSTPPPSSAPPPRPSCNGTNVFAPHCVNQTTPDMHTADALVIDWTSVTANVEQAVLENVDIHVGTSNNASLAITLLLPPPSSQPNVALAVATQLTPQQACQETNNNQNTVANTTEQRTIEPYVNTALVLCQGTTVRAISYHVWTSPTFMEIYYYQTVLDLRTSSPAKGSNFDNTTAITSSLTPTVTISPGVGQPRAGVVAMITDSPTTRVVAVPAESPQQRRVLVDDDEALCGTDVGPEAVISPSPYDALPVRLWEAPANEEAYTFVACRWDDDTNISSISRRVDLRFVPPSLPPLRLGWRAAITSTSQMVNLLDRHTLDCSSLTGVHALVQHSTLIDVQGLWTKTEFLSTTPPQNCSLTSKMTGIAMRLGEVEQIVQLSLASTGVEIVNGCPVDLLIDGQPQWLANGYKLQQTSNFFVTVVDGERIVLIDSISGVSMDVSVQKSAERGCFFSTTLSLAGNVELLESVRGLLGPSGSSPWNDGKALGEKSCSLSWCVEHQEESFFSHYFFNTSCDLSAELQVDLSLAHPGAELLELCESSAQCIMGGICGDIEDAEIALQEYHNAQPWIQMGGNITSVENGSTFGNAVALSADGSVLAIAAPHTDSFGGSVSVLSYDHKASEWNLLGQTIDGDPSDSSSDSIGEKIELSADGKIMAVMSLQSVQVFWLDMNTVRWKPMGQRLDDMYLPSLSADGRRIAVQASSSLNDTAFVFEYDIETDTWFTLGDPILSGTGVALSGDGENLGVLQSTLNHTNIRVYHWTGAGWSQLGDGVVETNLVELCRCSPLALSFDGSKLVFANALSETEPLGQLSSFGFDGNAWSPRGQTLEILARQQIPAKLSYGGNLISTMSRDCSIGSTEPDRILSLRFDSETSLWLEVLSKAATSGCSVGDSIGMSSEGQAIAFGSDLVVQGSQGSVRVLRW